MTLEGPKIALQMRILESPLFLLYVYKKDKKIYDTRRPKVALQIRILESPMFLLYVYKKR